MPATYLSSTQSHWIEQGIAKWKSIPGFSEFDLTFAMREWLHDNVKHPWYWDHFWEEAEVEIVFADRDEAMLFKLTWL